MKEKTAAWYFREIKRQLSMAPTQPARLDFMWTERYTMQKVAIMYGSEYAVQHPAQVERWRSLQSAVGFKPEFLRSNTFLVELVSAFCCEWSENFDLQREKQGLWRAAFFGPDYQHPKHFLDVPVRLRGRDSKAKCVDAQKQIEAVQQKYGPDYHIQYFLADADMRLKIAHQCGVTVNKGRDEHYAPLNVMLVWRGADWLAEKTKMFYPSEIARILPDIIMKVHSFKPDAERGRKNVEGGRRGGIKSGANRIARRGDCIEKHRDEFVRLCKTMKPRSAAIRIAKQSKFHFDAIAYHFRLHPTPPKP